MSVFKERGKPEYPEKNLSGKGRGPTTNSTHIWRRCRDSKPGHIGGRRVLSTLRHPCCPCNAYLHHVFSSYRPVLIRLQRIGIWKCRFLRKGENRSTRRKTSRGKGEDQQQTQPTYGVDAGIRTRATLVGGGCSQHCATLAAQKLLRITCTPHWTVPELVMYLKYLTTHAVEWPAAEFGGTNLFYSRGKTSPLDIVWRNQLHPLFRCIWRLSRLPPIQCPVKRRKNERYHHSLYSPKTKYTNQLVA